MNPNPIELELQLNQTTARLHERFEGTFALETIRRYVDEAMARMAGAKVVQWLPVLAERVARDQLRAIRKLQNPELAHKPHLVFLCVHNAGRSQMAAAWATHLAGDRVEVFSGGSDPASTVNPAAVDAMKEVGIDITDNLPQPWTDEIVQAASVVVTMGCGDACPIVPGVVYQDWDLRDPSGLAVEDVRPIRDEIKQRVEALLATLEVPQPA